MPSFARVQEIEHEIGPSGWFALRVTEPDVELRAVSGGKARVRISFDLRADDEAQADDIFQRVQYQVQRRVDSLEVNEPKQVGVSLGSIGRLLSLGSARFDAHVVAEIPAGAEVEIQGVSGDVQASGFEARQEYRTVSGDMFLRNLAGDIRIRGVSSDISLEARAPIRLEANTVSGDMSILAPRLDSLRLTTVSGDIDLEGQLSTTDESRMETVSGDVHLGVSGGATLEVRALSSDVRVSLPHRSEGSRDRRRYVIGDGAAHLVFSSMSGDLIAGPPRRSGPIPPVAPVPPVPPTAPVPVDRPPRDSEAELEILRALERGEISVDQAVSRLAAEAPDA